MWIQIFLLALAVPTIRSEFKCGECFPDKCQPPAEECLAGRVKDLCGCCDVCGRRLGEPCDGLFYRIPYPKRGYGVCGEHLECRLRTELSPGDPPETMCVCLASGNVCGTDNHTYDNWCQLTEAMNKQGGGLRYNYRGPCKYFTISFWGTPEQQTGNEGDDLMVICKVTAGDDEPTVLWYANGSRIFEGFRHTVTEGGLYIRSLRSSDAGDYKCQAIVITPDTVHRNEFKIQVRVQYSSREIQGVNDEEFEEFVPELEMPDFETDDNYEDFEELEHVVPDPPRFELMNDVPGVLIVKFAIPDSRLHILGYRIQWRLTTDSTWSAPGFLEVGNGPEYWIHDLNSESTYSVRAAAYNAVGYSEYSEEIIERTKDDSAYLSSALPSSSDIHGYHRQVALLVLCVVVFTFR